MCWLGKFVIVLEVDVVSEATSGSCVVYFGMVLYVVSLSGEIGAAWWSSCSRMIFISGVGSGDVLRDSRSGMA